MVVLNPFKQMKISPRAKESAKVILSDAVKWLLIYGAIGLGIYFVIVLYIVNLVDVKLIVSLLIVEVPLAVAISVMLGEANRNRLQDAVERLKSIREFSNLRIHKFGNPYLVRWYFVENRKTKYAYNPDTGYVILADNDLIETISHETEEKMHEYFKLNGIKFEDRPPRPDELT